MPQTGHYQSRFLRAVDPAAPRAVWIRQTTDAPPAGPATVTAWCTLFEADGPKAVRQPGPRPSARLDESGASGTAEAAGHRAAWSLRFTDAEPPLRHLPRAWMYRAPLPRTKLLAPEPAVRVSGEVEVDGQRVELDGWPGTTGENYGSEHAERWVWLHGIAFAEAPGAWLDVAIARVRVGRVLTPWVANGALRLPDGTRVPVGGLGRRALVDAAPDRLEATLHGPRRTRLELHVDAPLARTVAFSYTDPGGGGAHDVLHCSIAALRARLGGLTLTTAHGGAYERGVPTGDAL